MPHPSSPVTGLLLSGGMDSAILLGHLLRQGRHVQPFYIRSDVHWLREEFHAAQSLVSALQRPALRPLAVLDLPLADLYDSHWSMTGSAVPDGDTLDEAVYLPGRNALLVVKAAVWCQMNAIPELALATLQGNPFPDATDKFFAALGTALSLGCDTPIRIARPFEKLKKREILPLGAGLPLELTFSCLAPVRHQHCGRCNKCAERQRAFVEIQARDPTAYAQSPSPPSRASRPGEPPREREAVPAGSLSTCAANLSSCGEAGRGPEPS